MKVGLSGGIGCGKSTVLGFFSEAGWQTVDTDAVVRELLAADAEVQAQLLSRWGEAVFAEGGVDHAALAKRVFGHEDDLKWLEELLHPLVRESWQSSIAQTPNANWLVEIPLLFEKRLESRFDLTVCVVCPRNLAAKRMVARAYTEEQIEQRRKQQMPLKEKMELADYLISNAGSLEFLKQQTTRLIEQITTH
ncbi:MAG: dephospho-CoA kinase [Verrucomicrobiota bacterium]|nr:dephospho-CoA kinase [Verrucomicrobiota bacterium]